MAVRLVFLLSTALLLLAALPAQAETLPAPIAPQIEAALDGGEALEVIVRFDAGPTRFAGRSAQETQMRLNVLARRKQAVLAAIAPTVGQAEILHRYPHFPLMALVATPEQIRALAESEGVVGIFGNAQRRLYLDSSVPFLGADQWHDQGLSGQDTAVAVLDTGVQYWSGYFGTCDEVGAADCAVKAFVNFTNDDDVQTATYNPHGTNVAGIVRGVAPETSILSLNVFHFDDMAGRHVADDVDILDALDWVAENRNRYNIVAVNMSLGSERDDPQPCNGSPFFDAIESLRNDYDVVAAIASGNEAKLDSLGEPSCVTPALSVGAHFDTDVSWVVSMDCLQLYPVAGDMVCFSNRNGALDVVASGVWVSAAGYDNFQGTSMAAPHAAGAVALLQSIAFEREGGYLSAANLMRRMMIDATPMRVDGWNFQRLNLHADRNPGWVRMLPFDEFMQATPATAIAQAPDSYSVSASPAPAPGFIPGAPYLYLEIIHPAPGQVDVTLTAPDGTAASITLPSGLSNFNGVIGRELAPGAFAALTGQYAGTWTVSLSDTQSGDTGYYISATLFWPDGDCVPSCDGRTCGDDGCGGSCGDCADDSACGESGECLFDGEYCAGDSCDRPFEVADAPQSYTSSTQACSYTDNGSCGGGNAPERVYHFSLNATREVSVRLSADFDALIYLRKERCGNGREIDCVEVDDDGNAEISGDFEAGDYFLFIDGNDQGTPFGDYWLEVDYCEPDCTGRECGDDGCGGSCGACSGDGESCTDAGRCCAPDCSDVDTCGDDGCGGVCACSDEVCDADNDGARLCYNENLLACDTGAWRLESACEFGCEDGACLPEPDGDADADGDDDAPADGDVKNDDSGGCAQSGQGPAALLLVALGLVGLIRRRVRI